MTVYEATQGAIKALKNVRPNGVVSVAERYKVRVLAAQLMAKAYRRKFISRNAQSPAAG